MRYILLFTWLICTLTGFRSVKNGSGEDAGAIIRKAEDKMRGTTSMALMSIRTVRPNWSRELKMKTWTKGKRYAMLLITSPVREKGTVYLKDGKEVWNWVPSIERVIKLPPSMMTQSWMGTDFTNDDLVKESSVTDDYDHHLEGDSVIDGRKCWLIRLMPKPDAAVVWGKVLTWIDQKEYMEMRAEFYDEEGELVNTMKGSEVKRLGGRMLPSRMEMIPSGKTGHSTVMTYDSLVFDKPIEDGFFTPANMKKVK